MVSRIYSPIWQIKRDGQGYAKNLEREKVQAQTARTEADTQLKIAKLDLDRQKTEADVALKQQKLEIDAAKIVTG